MLPILTSTVLGIAGYQYFKYSKNAQQIGAIKHAIGLGGFKDLQDLYRKFGQLADQKLLKSIYDSIMEWEESLVPTYYHHINPLTLSALIPAAVLDYFSSKAINSYFAEKSLPQSSDYKCPTLKNEKPIDPEYYDNSKVITLGCAHDANEKIVTCQGSREPYKGKPKTELQKWLIKVPNVDDKIKINWLHRGTDKIDLREFNTNCEDLKVTQNTKSGINISIKNSATNKVQQLEVSFIGTKGLTCNDFIFNNNPEKNSNALLLKDSAECYKEEHYYKKSCTKESYFSGTVSENKNAVYCVGSTAYDPELKEFDKWIIKVPNIVEKDNQINILGFKQGHDVIDLRKFNIKSCGDLKFHNHYHYHSVVTLASEDVVPSMHYPNKNNFQIYFEDDLELTCNDFIFNTASE